MHQTCLVDPVWMIGLAKRGGTLYKVEGDSLFMYVKRGSTLDNEDNLRTTREFLKSQYSYTLKIAYVD